MKKFLLFGFILLTVACQNTTSIPITESTQTSTPQATLIPATETQAVTSTPEFTPTPIPLFFTDEFDSDTGVWLSFQTGGESNPTLKIENSLLRLDIPSPNTWYYTVHNINDYEDVFVSAKFTGTPSGSIGLICRYSDIGWYEFSLASDGTYNVLFAQWLGSGVAQYAPIANASSEYLQLGSLSYEIGLSCQKNNLLLYINGKLFRKLDVTRYGLTTGKIGLSVSSFDEVPMIASFDWVKVSEPE